MLNSRPEGDDGDCFIEVIDPELLLVEPIDEVLQRLSLLLPHDEEMSFGLRSVEQPYELADELLAELLEIFNRSWF